MPRFCNVEGRGENSDGSSAQKRVCINQYKQEEQVAAIEDETEQCEICRLMGGTRWQPRSQPCEQG